MFPHNCCLLGGNMSSSSVLEKPSFAPAPNQVDCILLIYTILHVNLFNMKSRAQAHKKFLQALFVLLKEYKKHTFL
jgi:hypothetical protein